MIFPLLHPIYLFFLRIIVMVRKRHTRQINIHSRATSHLRRRSHLKTRVNTQYGRHRIMTQKHTSRLNTLGLKRSHLRQCYRALSKSIQLNNTSSRRIGKISRRRGGAPSNILKKFDDSIWESGCIQTLRNMSNFDANGGELFSVRNKLWTL